MSSKIMTPKQFAKRMKEIRDDGDIEKAHWEADMLMCQLLQQLGYGDGVKLFTDMPKWYS